MRYSNQQLLERVASLDSFKSFDGIIDIWVRSAKDIPDKFDDKVYTFDCTGDMPKFKMVCTGTSHAGTFGLLGYKSYNRAGCAVSLPNIITYDSHVYGLHKGKPAYRQVKGIPYTRDNNGDKLAENFGKTYSDVIGLNCHRAGWFSQVIYNWSIACYVRNNLKEFLAWLDFMDKRKLSTVVLSEF